MSNIFENLLNDIPSISRPVAKKQPLLEHVSDHTYVLRIDNSTMETYQTCARSAFYYCIERKQRLSSAALAFGGAAHVALEHLYKHGKTPDETSIAIDLALRDYSKFQVMPDEWRTGSLLQTLIEEYVKAHRVGDDIIPLIHNGAPLVELPFSLQLGEIEVNATLPYTYAQLTDNPDNHELMFVDKIIVLWSGKIDVVSSGHNDAVYVVDHKTTSIGGPQFFADFMLSQQMVGYNWAVRRMLERPVNATIVNAIFCRRPTKTGKSIEFQRQTFFHTDWHVAEWERDVMAEVERFVYAVLNNSWPKLTKWCFGKYGKCQYHDVCTLPPQQRDVMLRTSEYTNVTWSPLNKEE